MDTNPYESPRIPQDTLRFESRLKNLTQEEERFLAACFDAATKPTYRLTSLLLRYAIAAALPVVLAIVKKEPWYAVITYVLFLFFMYRRFGNAKRAGGELSSILQKYEVRIAELEVMLPKS